jgi:metal-responsive CopG/Arc/MetJ family transcriptional regulator
MRRTTISLPDDLTRAVENYMDAQDAPPTLTAVMQAALRRYLAEEGYLRPGKKGRLELRFDASVERELLAGLESGPPLIPDEAWWERQRNAVVKRHNKRAAG